MYYIINITKWNNFTEHYYANIYNASIFTPTDFIMSGEYDLSLADKYSDLYPELYPTIKDSVERDVINKAADMILDNKGGLSAWICVFWNGKYSKARTLAINNDKAVLLLPKPLR